jgi:hypothetical protein
MEIPVPPDRCHRRRIILFVVGSILAVIALAGVVYFKDVPLGDHSDLEPKPLRNENSDAVEKILSANRAALDKAIRADALGRINMPQLKSFDDSMPS